MEQSLTPIHEMLSLHNKLFAIAIADVSEDHAQKRINGKGNPFIHLAGHITSTRFFISSLLGLQKENPLGDVFDGEYNLKAQLPSLKKVKKVFDEIMPQLMTQLTKVDASHLSGDLPKQFPVEEQNIIGGVSFLTEHEGYHIGQMGYIRIQLGYQSIYDTMFAKS